MKTKTLVIAAVLIAATAALALAPLATPNAMALRNGGSITVPTCTHNGNGETTEGPCEGKGKSSQDTSQTLYKCKGKFQNTPC